LSEESSSYEVKKVSVMISPKTRDKLAEIVEERQKEEIFKVTQTRLLTALIDDEYERLGLDKEKGSN